MTRGAVALRIVPREYPEPVLRGLTHRWRFRTGSAVPDTEPDLLRRLLGCRGFDDPEKARAFREPSLKQLHAPRLLPNIDVAARAVAAALRGGRSIVIYGDYDVDGITGSAILFHVMRALQPDARIATFVPHRLDEGYGLNDDALRQLRSGGADLVISVDCGITAVEPARVAREIGLELIVTDHHNPPTDGSPLPDCICVHPRLPDSAYPFHDLCGAGVAFKLAWHLATVWTGSERVGQSLQQTLLHLLPLAALGTIADVMPLVDENRAIAAMGLRMLRQTPIVGLRALIEATGLMGEKIDCEKVGFVLAPHLNAIGRMGHAAEAMQLLTTATSDEAVGIAHRLAEHNRQRRQTEREVLDRAVELAAIHGMTGEHRRIIVLAEESWHPGVVGIVCSRLAERYGRPAVLLQRQGDVCRGSARSIDGYSIAAALDECADLLDRYGGHDMAAGVTLSAANLPAFVERLTAHANAHIAPEDLTPALTIDCDVQLQELAEPVVRELGRFSPFGRGNPRPVFRLANARVAAPPRQMGRDGAHLDLRVAQEIAGRRHILRTVWWNAGERAAAFVRDQPLDLAIEPKINEFNGRTSVEAVIRDVRLLAPDRSSSPSFHRMSG